MRTSEIERNAAWAVALRKQELARRLREARKTRGLSQEKAAALIDVTAKTYGTWEAVPGAWPRVGYYDKISEVLGVAREHLLDEEVISPRGTVTEPVSDDELLELTRENNAMLRAVLAHLGISVESLADPPADLIAALGNGQSQRAKRSRRV